MSEKSKSLVMSEKNFNEFCSLIHQFTGITIGQGRETMIEGRVRKRMNELDIEDHQDYLAYIKTHNEEESIFVDLVTTNETYFYRTPRIWEYIETKLLPLWISENPGKTFRAWSAASSSGEEAHTLGMVCQSFKEREPRFDYHIVGTDISKEVVEKAQLGIYGDRSLRRIKTARPDWCENYLEQHDEMSKVVKRIKSHLSFQVHNLFDPFKKGGKFDLVLLRNVIIYFTVEDQKRVLKNLKQNMENSSKLVIGESESLSHFENDFESEATYIYRIRAIHQAMAS